MTKRGNEIRVGAVALLALLLLTAGVLWIGGFRPGRSRTPYRVRLANINGLGPGSAVRYGGHRVGEIVHAGIASDDPTRIELSFEVDPGTPIAAGTQARVNQVGLLADPFLEILPPPAGAEPLPADGLLQGRETRSIGDLVDGLAGLSVRAETSLTRIEEALDLLTPRLERVLDGFEDVLTEENRAHLASLLVELDRLAPELAALTRRLDRTLVEIDPLLDQAALLGGQLRETLPDVEHFTASGAEVFDLLLVRREELEGAITQLQSALGATEELASDARDFLAANREDIELLLDRAQTTLRYLEAFSKAVAERPSRVVWSGKQELEEE